MSALGLRCSGCGYMAPADAAPFRCPNARAGDDVDHVLTMSGTGEGKPFRKDGDPNPFLRYRRLLSAWTVARRRGLSDSAFVDLMRAIDEAVARIDGTGFRMTPYGRSDELDAWVKNETVNIAGSHKARHLMGLALHLKVLEATGGSAPEGHLAIASCGNAALAAAVVAKAIGRALDVYVPPEANPAVLDRLLELDARIVPCERRPELPPGDPCFHRFREGVLRGAIPFTCQGSENGLALDGGRTLGFEIVSQHLRTGKPLHRLFVQVGGGALLASMAQAAAVAKETGAVSAMPRIHSVQTEGGHPLDAAWRGVARDLARRLATSGQRPPEPLEQISDAALGRWIGSTATGTQLDDALRFAAQHRSRYMRPVAETPHSAASGILDDETYDWVADVRAMLETGGWPVVVPEARILEANETGRRATGIDVDWTGTAGLAGLLELRARGAVGADEEVAVLFTGRRREAVR